MRRIKQAIFVIVAIVIVVAIALLLLPDTRQPPKDKKGAPLVAAPVFSLAWSEHPSWSLFGLAHELKLIDRTKGKMGPIEKKWGVDVELKEVGYESSIVMYGSENCDAVCLTNLDALGACLRRPSAAIIPTSTSVGADALIVAEGITDIKQLRGKNVYGPKGTVSEYCFVRNLELLGEKEGDHEFTHMEPASAAAAFQQKKTGHDAIVVRDPFVVQTLNKRNDAKVLFDSSTIPGEIVGLVVVAQASLDKPGGKAFARAVIDTFYAVNRRIADDATRDATLTALGKTLADLDLKSMEKVVQQTQFYATPEGGIELLTGEKFKDVMKRVVQFGVSHGLVPKAPTIGYGDRTTVREADLRFDPSCLRAHVAKGTGPGGK